MGIPGGALRRALAAVVWGLVMCSPAAGQGVQPAVANGGLRLASPVRPTKPGTAVYLVQLREASAATYKGETPGFAATKPQPGRKLAARSAPVESYVRHLEDDHETLLRSVGAAGSKIYSYRYALNGFAARLTADQASRLAQSGQVARIWPDTDQRVQTNNSAIFLGLQNPRGGLRADLGLRGEDVVIGIIDSGIAPNHPALADTEERIPRACAGRWAQASWLGQWLCHWIRKDPPRFPMYAPHNGFSGICQEGDGFTASDCNDKLLGARYYIDGFLARHQLDPREFVSPKDADGHGTHIATIAAGNPVSAYLFGTRIGRVSGLAPRARIAVYKACWLKPGETRATCTTSDLARAIDDAVADGVDIINYSVGSLETDLTAPDDLALLNALDAGVLSTVAAGNDGPHLATIGSPSGAPWVLTVAASTQNGERFEEAMRITAPADLAKLIPMKEAAFTPPLKGRGALEEALVIVDDGREQLDDGSPGSRRDACEALLNADALAGRIALIERGGCEFQVKLEHAQRAGAIAAVVYNDAGPPIEMQGDKERVSIPGVMISSADGQQLLDALEAGKPVEVELAKGVFLQRSESGRRLGEFSSRGPALTDPDFVKPDVTAPGVNILAGHTPDVANGLRGESFQYLSGTSMSAPEAAGIAALLKQARPDWSPSALKSALITTASGGVVKEDGKTVAGPFDAGAGHLNPNAAVDPGLVYESSYLDYAAYLCGREDAPFPASECAVLNAAGFASEGRHLNLPSIGISELISGDVVQRTVTNLGPSATYRVEVNAPLGLDVSVQPSALHLASGQRGQFSVTFARSGAPLDAWTFGSIHWSDGEHKVSSPLALRPVTLRAPREVRLSGATGNASLPIAFGYGGAYMANVHGLRAALVLPGFVDDDVTNTFSFRFDQGVSMHLVTVPPDQLYARFALFDELTDGNDDLDLYLFFCPGNECFQIGESGSFTSEEEIDLTLPAPGLYAVLVHGFETDQASGGPGAEYSLLAWSVGLADDVGNLRLAAPDAASEGDRLAIDLEWGGLAPGSRYLGAISHDTPSGIYALTVLEVISP